MGGFETQRSFHRVQEHQKRTSDEEVMVVRCAEPAGAYCFLSFSDIIRVQVALIYIWVASRLKGLSIESKNSHNGILTKELCKLQAMKKIRNLVHLQLEHQQKQVLVIVGISINSIRYQDIYGKIQNSKVFP